tara:strand:+ start:97 stop:723 length:627 start_codon:yes stop_codon:yes gene_type:complete
MSRRTIDVLAERNEDWLKMAKSFKVSNDDAWELVQGMYLKLNDYVKDVDRIMYNETEINTFYVYTTISNLFNSGFHVTGGKGGKRVRKVVYSDNLFCDDSEYLEFVEKLEDSEKIDMDSFNDEITSQCIYDASFGNLKDDIDGVVSTWYWYQAKLFRLHFNKGMSMRKIAKETGISLKSVFNTLKAAKLRLREEFQKDYDRYKLSKKN